MSWTVLELAPGIVLTLEANDEALLAVRFGAAARETGARDDRHPVLFQAREELKQYWAGRRRVFSVAYEAEGTAFQCAVWKELANIPFGEIRSYAQIAESLGKPKAVRAVGAANGANPLPIIIPCHRVLAADGSLCGYGGGIEVKRALLAREGIEL